MQITTTRGLVKFYREAEARATARNPEYVQIRMTKAEKITIVQAMDKLGLTPATLTEALGYVDKDSADYIRHRQRLVQYKAAYTAGTSAAKRHPKPLLGASFTSARRAMQQEAERRQARVDALKQQLGELEAELDVEEDNLLSINTALEVLASV